MTKRTSRRPPKGSPSVWRTPPKRGRDQTPWPWGSYLGVLALLALVYFLAFGLERVIP